MSKNIEIKNGEKVITLHNGRVLRFNKTKLTRQINALKHQQNTLQKRIDALTADKDAVVASGV